MEMHTHFITAQKQNTQSLAKLLLYPSPKPLPPETMVIAESNKPHVAILPSPGMGHIIPLLELAKRLVIHHGFHVSFLVITTEASTAQNRLLRSPTLPPDLHVIDLPPIIVSSLVSNDTPSLTRLCTIAHASLKSLKSILIEINPIKALVIDLFTTEAFDVCAELSIPTYSFCTASTAFLALSLYLPTMDREVETEFVDLPEPVQVPGCTPIKTDDLLDQIRNRKIDEYKWLLFHVSRLPMATRILLNTWYDLESVTLQALNQNPFFKNIPIPPVHPIGPIINESVTESDSPILTWLDKQPADSVLFVVLGSGGTLSSDQLTELAWGLELSQQRFILVARKPNDASASAAFFSVGCGDADDPTSYLPDGFLKRTEALGLVVPSWAPQVAVLRHRSTGGFLSHCGWNSTLESVVHGIPIIAWPLYAEQRMNATILTEEVGVAVKPAVSSGEKVIGREEIERVVRLVMVGEEGKVLRRRAKELQDSARRALGNGGSSYDSLSHVLEAWN